jgi:hypothetical protein
MPWPDGPGYVMTIVCASGAVATIGLPPTIRLLASTLFVRASKIPCSENRTSADVNGAPSDQVTPGRRKKVCVRPSALDSQRSASHGSISKVWRLIRSRRPCISEAMTSAVWSRTAKRLKERGSPRTVDTAWPPRAGAVVAGASSLLLDCQRA